MILCTVLLHGGDVRVRERTTEGLFLFEHGQESDREDIKDILPPIGYTDLPLTQQRQPGEASGSTVQKLTQK